MLARRGWAHFVRESEGVDNQQHILLEKSSVVRRQWPPRGTTTPVTADRAAVGVGVGHHCVGVSGGVEQPEAMGEWIGAAGRVLGEGDRWEGVRGAGVELGGEGAMGRDQV